MLLWSTFTRTPPPSIEGINLLLNFFSSYKIVAARRGEQLVVAKSTDFITNLTTAQNLILNGSDDGTLTRLKTFLTGMWRAFGNLILSSSYSNFMACAMLWDANFHLLSPPPAFKA